MYRSAADLVSRMPVVDPMLQAQYDYSKRQAEERAAAIRKQEEEHKRQLDAVNRAKEQGRIKGHARVKAVPTGDSILLTGQPTSPNSLPPEKLLFLSGLEAPKLGRRGAKDEAFAWQARETLRKLLIGKTVVFAVAYVHHGTDKITGQPVTREYGTVLYNDQDISKFLVANGLAKVKVSKTQSDKGSVSQDRQELLDLESKAREEKIGIWKEGIPEAKKVRNIEFIEKDPKKFFDKFKKATLHGIVEQVRDGSTVRVEVVDPEDEKSLNYYSIVVHISGIQCPRVPPPYSVLYEQYLKKKETDPHAREPVEEQPAPFGLESKLFTEMRLLNRDVDIQLYSIDKSGNIFGSVLVPQGNIAVSLLKNGLAKLVQWSAAATPEAALLEAAEREAKERGLNQWYGFKQEHLAAASDKRDFTAKVIQVLSGDTLVVVDSGNFELKLTLSSIRAPRLGSKREKQENYALESKEFLRKKLIGHKVQVIVEYTKTSEDNKEDRVYGAVVLNRQNIAEQLVLNGLATVLPHRIDEQRSAFYEALLAAEQKAEKTKKGVFSKTVPPAKPLIDLSEKVRVSKDAEGDENDESFKKKSDISVKQRQYLPFLQKQKNLQAVVEYVFGGNRFKILIPKENCVISFSLSGIRCPLAGRKENDGDPFGAEAVRFTRERILQHDVAIEVENLDKGGNFVGNLFYGRSNLAIDLLQAGLASIFAPSADRSKFRDELYRAEQLAKTNRIAIWHDYVEKPVEETPKTEEVTEEKEEEADSLKLHTISVTEIIDPANFYFQFTDDKLLSQIEEKLAALSSSAVSPVIDPVRGQIYGGLYNDGTWYRCRFERYSDDDGYQVFFVDYGNVDVVPSLRNLDIQLAKMKPAAHLGSLSGLKFARDYYDEAWEALASFVENNPVFAEINYHDRSSNKYSMTLRESKDSEHSINSILLREGLLRIGGRRERRLYSVLDKFKIDETFARKKHFGMWQYGDVSSDEEEDSTIARNKRA